MATHTSSAVLPRTVDKNAWFHNTAIRVFVLVLLFTAAAVYESVEFTAYQSNEVWIHLRVGSWIFQNHAIPHFGIYSQDSNSPWVATSWLFDLIAGSMESLLGLRAVGLIAMGLSVCVAVLLFLLAKRATGSFYLAVGLAAIAQFAIGGTQPLPQVCSFLLLGIETAILLRSRQTGDWHHLLWLFPIFVLWANLHPQFLLGLAVLTLFLVVGIGERWLARTGMGGIPPSILSFPKSAAVCLLVTASTLCNPFGYKLIPAASVDSYSPVLFRRFADMASLGFRRPQDFVLILLVLGVFFALGRQHSRDLFKWSLLTVLLLLALRIQRDAPYAVIGAVAILGGGLDAGHAARRSAWERPTIIVLVLAVVSGLIAVMPRNASLIAMVSRNLPVRACDFIRANHLPAPMFNSYPLGDFLTWYLPEYPVAIDSRLNLYGDRRTAEHFRVLAGSERLESNEAFSAARVIVLERGSGMAKALTTLAVFQEQFQVAYQDDVAIVLVRK